MSVLVPDLSVYNYIRNGFEIAAYRRVCDEYYAAPISQWCENKDIFKESKRFVLSLLNLNQRSYDIKYKTGDETDLRQFMRWTGVGVRPHQLLKYLKCVRYNIEIETIQQRGDLIHENLNAVTQQEQDDYKLLGYWIEALMMAIIDKIPEYDNAKWSEAV